jgi:hypothetical protein
MFVVGVIYYCGYLNWGEIWVVMDLEYLGN